MDEREFWDKLARHLMGIVALIGKRFAIDWITRRPEKD